MKTIKTILIGLAVFGFIFTGQRAFAAWTGPTASPPGANTFAPVNSGDGLQYKSGALGIGGLFTAYSDVMVGGNLSFSGLSGETYRLNVSDGKINARQVCINGFCKDAWDAVPVAGGNVSVVNNNISGASQWTTSGSDIYYNTGKVAVGNTNFNEALDVSGGIMSEGPSAGTSRLILKSTAAGGQQYEWYNDLGTVGNIGLYNRTNGVVSLTVTPSGNIGISGGVALPVWNLRSDGVFYPNDNDSGELGGGGNKIRRASFGSGGVSIGSGISSYPSNGLAVQGDVQAGKFQTRTTIGQGKSDQSFYDLSANTIGADSSIYSYGLICVGNSSGSCGGTGGTVISATGVKFPDGTTQTTAATGGGGGTTYSAGAGLNLTGTTFSLASSGTTGKIAKFTGANVLGDSSLIEDGSGNIGISGGVALPVWDLRSDGVFYPFADNTGRLGGSSNHISQAWFGMGGVSIGSYTLAPPGNGLAVEGNVGIGTASPGARLDVQADIPNRQKGLVVSGGIGTDYLVDFSNALITNPNLLLLRAGNADGSSAGYALNVSSWDKSVSRFVVMNSGNVGIGTPIPNVAYKIDVQGGTVNASGGLCINGDCKTAWSQVGGGGGTTYSAGTGLTLSGTAFSVTTGGITSALLADDGVTSAKIADGTIANADISSTAAVAGTKISPNFGSQNVITTGDIKLGANANLFAPGSGENLRIVRGTLNGAGGCTVTSGAGFTCIESSTGAYTITFNSTFSSPPTVTVTGYYGGANNICSLLLDNRNIPVSVAGFRVRNQCYSSSYIGPVDAPDWSFIAVGPR